MKFTCPEGELLSETGIALGYIFRDIARGARAIVPVDYFMRRLFFSQFQNVRRDLFFM
jgi:hypothetical protein